MDKQGFSRVMVNSNFCQANPLTGSLPRVS